MELGTTLGAETERATLPEAGTLGWKRERVSERSLQRDGRRWTMWTSWVVALFTTPGVVLLAIEPWTAPAALLCFAHAWAVPGLQARRGARSLDALPVPGIGSGAQGEPEAAALGLLADLVGKRGLDLLRDAGVATHRGRLGIWLLGESGAILVRPRSRLGGRRVFGYCARVGKGGDLPPADRVAHLLLALREDEEGFATVANMGFSGALWRVRRHMRGRERAALAAACSGSAV